MSKNNAFAVRFPSSNNDRKGYFKKALMNIIMNDHPHLSIAGLDEPEYDKYGRLIRSVEYAGPKNILGFGLSKDHDVSFVSRREEFLNNPFVPVYDLETQWNEVVGKLMRFSKERENPCSNCPFANICVMAKKPKYPVFSEADGYYLPDGTKVSIFGNFIKIGTTIIPRVITRAYLASASFETVELIKRTMVTITRLA